MQQPGRPAQHGSKPFDVAAKYLLEADPPGWLAYLGLRSSVAVTVVDSDVSTIVAAADRVLRVDDPAPWMLHVEFQSSADATLDERLHFYNAALRRRHRVPVRSVALLLRPAADTRTLTELLRDSWPDGSIYLEFRYTVVRVWQQPVESLLAGSLATLPLAPLAAGAEVELPLVVQRVEERLLREAPPTMVAELAAATQVLLGLRYPEGVTRGLLGRVRNMRESATYQAILAEGRAEEARQLILHLGSQRFGPPDARTRAALEAISDPARLDSLGKRLLEVTSWDDLLAAP